jgi:hypothetical protein
MTLHNSFCTFHIGDRSQLVRMETYHTLTCDDANIQGFGFLEG